VSTFTGWLQKHRQIIIIVSSIIIILLIAFALAVSRFGWDWTGFNEQIGPQLHQYQPYQPAKTLWDVLQLFIIPAVLAVIAFLFNRSTSRKEREEAQRHYEQEQEFAQKRAETEQEIAADNQREAALQAYLDKMSELLLKEGLSQPETDEEVRNIARARTLTVLRSLDPVRKGSLLRFLYETNLIHKDVGNGIIDLSEADLSGAVVSIINLIRSFQPGAPRLSKTWMSRDDLLVDLRRANLSRTNLKEAKLYGVKLQEADLSGAYLSKADLSEARLCRARLHETRLRKTILQRADLSETDLRGAYLRLADLSESNLSGADLTGAVLSEAILDKADLRGAIYTPEQLDKVKSRTGVIL
jgi:uncharacterized protein YjbI with pentapeptide repeats